MIKRRTTAAVLGLAIVAGCDRGEPGAVEAVEGPVDVAASRPVRAAAVDVFPASVVSTDRADLATRTSGTVREVRVDVGSRVSAGDTLVELDAEDVEARVEAAEAALSAARKRHERIRNLARDGAATEQELDDARAALRRAEAGVREARAQRAYVVLRAPFSGTVTERRVDPGDLAVPGRPVLALVRPGALEVVADLPGAVAARIRQGERLSVRDPESGRAVPARVTRVSPARDPASRRVRVELALPEGARRPGGPALLSPGAYVRLEREDPETSTIWIPRDAVVRRGQLTGVFVVRDSALDLRWIRLGAVRGEAVESLAGVGAGALLVRRPAEGLVDGAAVGAVTVRAWSPEPPASSDRGPASSATSAPAAATGGTAAPDPAGDSEGSRGRPSGPAGGGT